MFQRPIFQHLLDRLTEPRRFMQVLSGPRQVGKTTLARQVIAQLTQPSHYASADAPSPQGPVWLEQQWEVARLQAREDPGGGLLALVCMSFGADRLLTRPRELWLVLWWTLALVLSDLVVSVRTLSEPAVTVATTARL